MGLRPKYIDYIEECVAETLGDLRGKHMLELGNQRITTSRRITETTGRAYFTKRGCDHVAIDLNGEDGALPLDLAQTIDKPEWTGHFDIITNSGTTEHVEPYEAQYECFENLHRWLATGGIAAHLVPDSDELTRGGRWKGHCNNYYSLAFFEALAENNGYRVVAPTIIRELVCVCLVKETDEPFMSDRDAFLEHITRTSGGKHYAGINDAGFSGVHRAYQKARRLKKRLYKALRGR